MMKDKKQILVRAYEEGDASFLAAIYFNTIHTVNANDYSLDQINAWAPKSSLEIEGWVNKWQKKVPPIVATLNHEIVGFVEFEENGHIDCFYCHHAYQGCGVGSALMKAVEEEARKKKIERIFAEVSITAKPFFEAKGFNILNEQSVSIRGVMLTNFVMEKKVG